MKKRTRRRLHAVRRERRAHRNYKDSLFRKLFSEKTKAIELYNALSGASYDETVPFEFWTLDNVFVDGQVNDLCCSIDGNLAVFLEAQSTICGCIAHRMLGYVSRSLDRYLAQVDIYGEKAKEIPAISFYVLYSGAKPWKDEYVRLSDSFRTPPEYNSLELTVKVVSMRYPADCPKECLPLELQRSKTLFGYQTLIQYVEEEMKCETANLGDSVSVAISRCIQENILSDFLGKYETEVKQMILGGRTQEEIMRVRLRCQREEGREEGHEEVFTSMLKDGIEPERAARIAKIPMDRAWELVEKHGCHA